MSRSYSNCLPLLSIEITATPPSSSRVSWNLLLRNIIICSPGDTSSKRLHIPPSKREKYFWTVRRFPYFPNNIFEEYFRQLFWTQTAQIFVENIARKKRPPCWYSRNRNSSESSLCCCSRFYTCTSTRYLVRIVGTSTNCRSNTYGYQIRGILLSPTRYLVY